MGTAGESRSVTRFRTQLAEVCARLNEHDVSYVLIGARAMQLWGTSRATRDIDILIEPTLENARRTLDALADIGFGYARNWSPKEIIEKPVTVIGDAPRVDLFTVAWSLRYTEAAASSTSIDLEGVSIPTASIDHLIASKRTERLQDAADIEALEALKRLRGD